MNDKIAGLGNIDGGQIGAAATKTPVVKKQPLRTKPAPEKPAPAAPSALEQAAMQAAAAGDQEGELVALDADIERLMNLRAQKTGIARPSLREGLRHQMRVQLSDEDILRMYEAEDADQFYIDLTVVPADKVYEWKRLEVYGKEDKGYEAELARRGWTPVQADEHPGYFMPKKYSGPVLRSGQGLFSMPAIEYQNRARYQQIKARGQVEDQERALGMAPSVGGVMTGPRDLSPKTRPSVQKNYEQVAGHSAYDPTA